MEIAELKIGNWVNDRGNSFPMQITTITSSCIGEEHDYVSLGNKGDCLCKDLKPIPFTEELFLKNNFTKQTFVLNGKNNNSLYKLIKDTASIQVSYIAESYVRVDIIDKDNTITYSIPRQHIYVHELQNLYSELTKKELELEL
jgi:hypothetical protein